MASIKEWTEQFKNTPTATLSAYYDALRTLHDWPFMNEEFDGSGLWPLRSLIAQELEQRRQEGLVRCPRCEKHTNPIPKHRTAWSVDPLHKARPSDVLCEYCGWKLTAVIKGASA